MNNLRNIANIIKTKPLGKRKKKVDFIAKNKQKIREMSAEVKNRQPRIRHNMDPKFNYRQKTPGERIGMNTTNVSRFKVVGFRR